MTDSLHSISTDPTDVVLEAIESSHIATLEVMDRLVRDRSPELLPRLTAFVGHSRVRVATIHALFGQAYDLSAPDEQVQRKGLAVIHAAIDTSLDLGAPIVVVHASSEPILPEERAGRLQRAQTALQEVGMRCEEVGVQVAIELLPRSCLGNSVEELLALIDGLSEKVFGVCLDTNHLMDRAQDLPRAPGALGSKLDWRAFMQALREAGYAGPYNYECQIDGDTPQDRIEALEGNWRWLSTL